MPFVFYTRIAQDHLRFEALPPTSGLVDTALRLVHEYRRIMRLDFELYGANPHQRRYFGKCDPVAREHARRQVARRPSRCATANKAHVSTAEVRHRPAPPYRWYDG